MLRLCMCNFPQTCVEVLEGGYSCYFTLLSCSFLYTEIKYYYVSDMYE
jgi:hypothetical protein